MKFYDGYIPEPRSLKLPLLVFITGIAFGFILVFFYSRFKNMWALLVTAAMIMPFVFAIFGEVKRFLWIFLVIGLVLNFDITLAGKTKHLGGTAGYMLSLFDMVLLCLYMVWLSEMALYKRVKLNFFLSVSIPVFVMLILATLSMLFGATYPYLSKFEILELIKMYLGFFYLANNLNTKNDVSFILFFLILALAYEGTLGVLQHRYEDPLFPIALGGPYYIGSRVSGSWMSYNDFAWYLTYFLPIVLSLLFAPLNSYFKALCGFALFTGSAALIWTNSRAGWLSFTIAGIMVSILILTKIRGKKGLINLYMSIIAISILVSPLFPRVAAKMYNRFTGDDGGSAESRLPQFEIAHRIIQAYPFFGVGINNYSEIMYDYDTSNELESITPHPVHNIYLHMAAEMGIFFVPVFIWFLAAIFRLGLGYFFLYDDYFAYAVAGMLAGIVAFLIHGFFDAANIANKLFLYTWAFAGIICALRKIQT